MLNHQARARGNVRRLLDTYLDANESFRVTDLNSVVPFLRLLAPHEDAWLG